MKHKHADLIHAWADGAEIEVLMSRGLRHGGRDLDIFYEKWVPEEHPDWMPCREYRIKPGEKKPVVRWLWACIHGELSDCLMEEAHGKYVVKLEWSRTEFPE